MQTVFQPHNFSGFEGLVGIIPPVRKSVSELVAEANIDSLTLEHLHRGGLRSVPVASEYGTLANLINEAALRLTSSVENLEQRTSAVIFCHSLPVFSPSEIPFFQMCLNALNLEHVPYTAVGGQPCAVFHFGVQLALRLLQKMPPRHGVLMLAGDMAYTPEDRIFFNSAMGDVAIAGFLSRCNTRHNIISCFSDAFITASEGERSAPEEISQFRLENPTRIRIAIETCLKNAGVKLSELKYIIPHTPYLSIWDVMSKLLDFPRHKILTDYLPDTGHLNSTDSIVHYIRAISESKVFPGDYILLVNPGFGGSRGCTLIMC